VRFLLDENIPLAVYRQLQRKHSELNVVRVVDVGLMGEPDDVVLDFAASEGRVVLSRDKATLMEFAFARVEAGLPMSGLILVTQALSVGRLLEELELVIEFAVEAEFEAVVYFIP